MKIVKRMPKGVTLVCVRWSAVEQMLMPDNVIANCAECGHAIQHRPHAPKKSRKVCMQCMEIDKDTELLTTQRMIDDHKAYVRGQKQ
jgi:hypothetical protein